MPIRKRKSKARASDVAAWAMYFQSGRDFFRELDAVDLTEATAAPVAERVWREIGKDVIAYLAEFYRGYAPPTRPFWAEEQFGPPSGKRRRR